MPIKDISNIRFGRLIAIELTDNRTPNNNVIWKCICDCGNITYIASDKLVKGATKSCGCSRNKLPGDQGSLKLVYKGYKRSARIRCYLFELTLEQFATLTKQTCVYCGAEPNQVGQLTWESKNTDRYIYNGLDRVDNAIGYTIDNVVACCGICNFMKGKMSYSDFMNHIHKIANKDTVNKRKRKLAA